MSAYQTYQHNQIQGASPLGLVLLTYEALNKALGGASAAITSGDIQGEAHCTSIAIEALIDLSSSLDMQAGGAVAQSLVSLYVYMINRLHDGMCSGSAEHLEEVARLAGELREAWMNLPDQQPQPLKMVNSAG